MDTTRTGRQPNPEQQQVAEEFVSSQANSELLQHDLAQAKELLFREYIVPRTTSQTRMKLPQPRIGRRMLCPYFFPIPEDTTNFPKILQLFHPCSHYDKVEHVWDRTPFWVQRMWTFLGIACIPIVSKR